jgi:hypothetical protein
MDEFITITEHGQPIKQAVGFRKLLAYNGFTVGVHGEAGNWNATELTTGLSVASNFKTQKAIIAKVDEVKDMIPAYVIRNMAWLSSCESWNR